MFWKLQENVIGDADLDLLVDFIRTTKRFTQFSKVREYEEVFAAWQGCAHAVFVNSGSSANLMLVSAAKNLYKWQDGDEVLVPAVTWPTTVTPVTQLGLKPVFVDVNLNDLSFDYERLEARITSRTRGIFVAHLLGFPANMEKLINLAERRGLRILEDCCESQGARFQGTRVGNFGVGGTFSFYWGHHMTTVEGGMICTNDEEMYKMLVLKRSHGLARELPAEMHESLRVQHSDIDFNFLFLTDGFNFRNTEFSAVLGLSQVSRLDEFIKIRNRNYHAFVELCRGYPDDLMVLDVPGISSFVLPFLFRNQSRKVLFQKHIREAGIESRPLISGNLLRQPFLSSYYNPTDFCNADFLHDFAFYIGNNQFVDEGRMNRLSSVMAEFFNGHRL